MFKTKLIDNSKRLLKELDDKIELALSAVGEAVEGHAKEGVPVDTGRLKNSLTYATYQYPGKGTYEDDEGNKYADAYAKVEPEKYAVYVGTNVEYAAIVEFKDMNHNEGDAHFLKNALVNHIKEYEVLAKKALM